MEIKFFKKEKHFKKENSLLTMDFFWSISVCILSIAFLLAVFFGYQLFVEVNKEGDSAVNAGGQIENVKKERINKILEYFALKKQKSNEIINTPVLLVDPSI